MAEKKTFPYDDQFPDNVDPTEANRKAFSDQMEKDRKALEKDGEMAEGEKIGGEVLGEPREPKTRQSGAVSK